MSGDDHCLTCGVVVKTIKSKVIFDFLGMWSVPRHRRRNNKDWQVGRSSHLVGSSFKLTIFWSSCQHAAPYQISSTSFTIA